MKNRATHGATQSSSTKAIPSWITKNQYFLGVVVAFIGTIIAYWESFWYPFIFDDVPTITQNFLVKYGTLKTIFNAHGRWVSILINNWVASNYGFNPFYFRMVNLFTHGITGFLFFYVTRLLLKELKNNQWIAERVDHLAALAAALYFLHPVQTQTAVYISQMRLEGLVLFLTLVGLTAMLKLHHAESILEQIGWYSLAMVAFFLGAGSKEIIVVVPLLIALTEFTFIAQGDLKVFLDRMLLYLPLFIILYATFLHFAQPFSVKQVLTCNIELDNNRGNVLTDDFKQKMTSLHFLSGQFRIFLHYIKIFFFPAGLCFDYGWKLPSSWTQFTVWGNLLVLLSLYGYLLHRWLRDKTDLIAWASFWFAIALAPRTSIIPTAELVCDYKTYLGSFGMMILLSYLLLMALDFISQTFYENKKTLHAATYTFLFFFMIYAVHDRNKVWSGELPFWSDVILKQETKSARVYNNYAAALYAAGQKPQAIQMLLASCQADPTYAEPLINLGTCAVTDGRDDEAIQYYEKAVSFLHEPHVEAFTNLAHLYFKKGLYEKALIAVVPALQLNPFYKTAWEVLALAYGGLNHPCGVENAIAQSKVTTEGFDVERHCAVSYFFQNNIPEALTRLEQVIKKENCFFYNFMIASCYYQQARYEKSSKYYGDAHAQDPSHINCTYNFGMSLLNEKKYKDAYELFTLIEHEKERLPFLLLQCARCEHELGHKEAARNTINQILTSTTLPAVVKNDASQLALLIK